MKEIFHWQTRSTHRSLFVGLRWQFSQILIGRRQPAQTTNGFISISLTFPKQGILFPVKRCLWKRQHPLWSLQFNLDECDQRLLMFNTTMVSQVAVADLCGFSEKVWLWGQLCRCAEASALRRGPQRSEKIICLMCFQHGCYEKCRITCSFSQTVNNINTQPHGCLIPAAAVLSPFFFINSSLVIQTNQHNKCW